MEKLITYTNAKIYNWYINAKKDYGITGSGSVRFTSDMVIVDYTEDGVKKEWSMPFYSDYLKEQKIDWFFNCWAERM